MSPHSQGGPGYRTGLIAQARLRVGLGIPVLALIAISGWIWGAGTKSQGPLLLVAFVVSYIAYAAMTVYLSRRSTERSAPRLLFGSAVADPLMLTIALALTGDAAPIFVAFYLFTILGFGFRIGVRSMTLCHLSSLLGFTIVAGLSPTWTLGLVETLTLGAFLLVIPVYATVLIAQLRKAHERAERESLEKSKLLTMVTHELRTPLTGIVASCQLMQDSHNHQDTTRYADTIIKLSAELNAHIDNLLDYSRHQSDGLILAAMPANPRRLLDELVERLRPSATIKGLDLHVSFDSRADRLFELDLRLLNSVLTNLAGNAIKFTDHGHVIIDMRVQDEQDGAATLRFQVSDTGPGIPEEFQSRIFEPFFQVGDRSGVRRHGTGLGTTIAQMIVQAMGGELRLVSTVGVGSRLWFDVTLRKTDVDQQHALVPQTAGPANLAALSILLADDDPTNRRLIAVMLERDGHEVHVASSGVEALELLAHMPVDAVVLDYNLGDMDGAQVLHMYRLGRLDGAPVIVLTADTSSQTAANVLGAGASMVLHKPVTMGTLRGALAELLGSEGVRSCMPVKGVAVVAGLGAELHGPLPAPEERVLHAVPVDFVDLHELENLREVNSSAKFLMDMVSASISEIERNVQDLYELIDCADAEGVRHKAHALKSACVYMGAMRLSAIAAALMETTQSQLRINGKRWRGDLRAATGPTVDALKKWLEPVYRDAESGVA